MRISKIISAARTGPEAGALEAADYCRIGHGGYYPSSALPTHQSEHGLYSPQKMTASDYIGAVKANIIDSDLTLIFRRGMGAEGLYEIPDFLNDYDKSFLDIDLLVDSEIGAIDVVTGFLQWNTDSRFMANKEIVLHVTGDDGDMINGMGDQIMGIIVDVLRAVNEECRAYYPVGV